jgi:surface antigen
MFAKLMAVAIVALGLSACASTIDYSEMPRPQGRSVVRQEGQKAIQCAPYAREHSKIKIYGDAYTWWDQASGKYPRGSAPEKGSILVLYNYAGAQRGHLAVVRTLVSSREIRVDHANWLNDGSIFVNNPVLDVSSANDWSQVRVFNLETGAWGSRVYPVRGFIGSDRDIGDKDGDLVASLAGGSGEIRTLIGEIH